MFIFFHLDECCAHFEVYYQTKNEAYDNQDHVYGNYTKMSGTVNGRSHYQSDFDVEGAKVGIWWCSDYSVWMIGQYSDLGECIGFAGGNKDVECPQNVGWNWIYYDGQAWVEAGEGLGVKCRGMQ